MLRFHGRTWLTSTSRHLSTCPVLNNEVQNSSQSRPKGAPIAKKFRSVNLTKDGLSLNTSSSNQGGIAGALDEKILRSPEHFKPDGTALHLARRELDKRRDTQSSVPSLESTSRQRIDNESLETRPAPPQRRRNLSQTDDLAVIPDAGPRSDRPTSREPSMNSADALPKPPTTRAPYTGTRRRPQTSNSEGQPTSQPLGLSQPEGFTLRRRFPSQADPTATTSQSPGRMPVKRRPKRPVQQDGNDKGGARREERPAWFDEVLGRQQTAENVQAESTIPRLAPIQTKHALNHILTRDRKQASQASARTRLDLDLKRKPTGSRGTTSKSLVRSSQTESQVAQKRTNTGSILLSSYRGHLPYRLIAINRHPHITPYDYMRLTLARNRSVGLKSRERIQEIVQSFTFLKRPAPHGVAKQS
ncbi:hypothetical protein SISNIDRAFT_485557 [Sistotremastrum niveocremeum HHB9708]|uniref:Uncharacterized protein n=1 Tax=Sistotremastrum niveocremeum HHB9708 TaxID=1314777 RepID=A0A164UJG7_9AGAM|nr:hypothetical protein SISNIDRAFT_485557 [Sistotremastrum niveocremeum HHB9708]